MVFIMELFFNIGSVSYTHLVLAQGPVRIRRAPLLRDVDTSLQLLEALGCPAVRAGGDLLLVPGGAVGDSVPPQLMAAMRSSIYYLAPMLARGGRARITFPGGCRLGARPIDIHLPLCKETVFHNESVGMPKRIFSFKATVDCYNITTFFQCRFTGVNCYIK